MARIHDHRPLADVSSPLLVDELSVRWDAGQSEARPAAPARTHSARLAPPRSPHAAAAPRASDERDPDPDAPSQEPQRTPDPDAPGEGVVREEEPAEPNEPG